MPIYEYECRKCGENFELIHSHTDESAKPCQVCDSKETYKVIGAPAVFFKGSGFYCNDSKTDAREQAKKQYEGSKYQKQED